MIVKKCRHGRGLTGAARMKAWRSCPCAWIASVTVDGHRSYVNLGADETEAIAAYHDLAAARTRGTVKRRRPGKAFRDVADSYLHAVRTAPSARPNRVRTTTSRVEHLKDLWGDVPVDGITVQQVRRFLDDAQARYAPNTAIALYSALRSVMGHAQDHGLVGALPLPARSRLVKVGTRQPNHLTLQDAARVTAALPNPYRQMAEVALLTGLRVGELAAVTVGDVDLKREVLHVRGTLHHDGTVGPPKTANGRRVVPLSAEALGVLRDATRGRATADRVFPVPSLAMCGYVMRAALRSTGLYRPGRGWHALRHAHTAVLEASGLSIRDAAARLGHGANFVQTASYGWAAEAGGADGIDETVTRLRHAATSSEGRRHDQG